MTGGGMIDGNLTMDKATLLNGDCLELMPTLPDGSVDLVVCDLPYGVLNRGNDSARWDSIIPMEPLWKQYRRIIKDNGAIILFSQGMFTAQLMMSAPDLWRYNLIWNKVLTTGMLNAKKMPLRCHEDICVFYKSQPAYHPIMTRGEKLHTGKQTYVAPRKNSCYGSLQYVNGKRENEYEKYPVSVLTFPKPHPSVTVHPTQKSVDLIRYLIMTYSDEGDLVLDNTMGSGTTGVAALMEKRRFVGIEKDAGFFRIAQRRIREAESEPTLF